MNSVKLYVKTVGTKRKLARRRGLTEGEEDLTGPRDRTLHIPLLIGERQLLLILLLDLGDRHFGSLVGTFAPFRSLLDFSNFFLGGRVHLNLDLRHDDARTVPATLAEALVDGETRRDATPRRRLPQPHPRSGIARRALHWTLTQA